jgi:hypothetical protein
MSLLRLAMVVLALPLLSAQALVHSTPVFDGPVPVKLNKKIITIPVRLYAELAGDDSENIVLHAYARAADLAPIMREQLQVMADKKISACEFRIKVPETEIGVGGPSLIVTTSIRAEVWVCAVLKSRIGDETARIIASAQPTVRDGQLHFIADRVDVDGVSELATTVGGDQLLQDLYARAIERLNRSHRLTSLPEKLTDAGFAYQAVEVGTFNGEPSMVRVSIIGPNDLVGLARILAGFE